MDSFLLNLRRLYQKQYFLPVLITFTYFCLIVDTIKYPGFISAHFLIDAKIYFLLAIIFTLFYVSKKKIPIIISRINIIMLIATSLIYFVFTIIDQAHYPNYVLLVYHFHLNGLIYVLLFNLCIFLVEKLHLGIPPAYFKKNIEVTVLTFLVIYVLFTDIGTAIDTSLSGDLFVLTHLISPYEQKMVYQWGNYYEYMVFVKNNTPPDAEIVIPPQIVPWLRVGNNFLDEYFLYPRKLVQYEIQEIPDSLSTQKGIFIMIAWGDWDCDKNICSIWPIQKINAQEEISKDQITSGVKEIKNKVIYDPNDTRNPYGLLKI